MASTVAFLWMVRYLPADAVSLVTDIATVFGDVYHLEFTRAEGPRRWPRPDRGQPPGFYLPERAA